MAKDVTGNPWKFDAATQAEGLDNSGVFDHPIYVKTIAVSTVDHTGDSTVDIHDASGGRLLWTVEMSTNDREQYVIDDFVQGIYITTLPSGATVFVNHGK